ncbi:50S ribosomal protein L18 [Candidatus Woesearchaeota archaeon]|nr:MAG: 50S ribosomal protein L18 [Candidatus Woesearchaeota archaeon]
MSNKVFTVPKRRKREGKTDYRFRMRIIRIGQLRLVIRRSLKNIWGQIVEFHPDGDRVLFSAHSRELLKFGWKLNKSNTCAAYLTGLLLAKKIKKELKCAVDIGFNVSVKGSCIYAFVQGVVDGGLLVNCDKKVVPSVERLRGEHIVAFAKLLKSDKSEFERQFGGYLKNGLDPEKVPVYFEEVKKKISGL